MSISEHTINIPQYSPVTPSLKFKRPPIEIAEVLRLEKVAIVYKNGRIRRIYPNNMEKGAETQTENRKDAEKPKEGRVGVYW